MVLGGEKTWFVYDTGPYGAIATLPFKCVCDAALGIPSLTICHHASFHTIRPEDVHMGQFQAYW